MSDAPKITEEMLQAGATALSTSGLWDVEIPVPVCREIVSDIFEAMIAEQPEKGAPEGLLKKPDAVTKPYTGEEYSPPAPIVFDTKVSPSCLAEAGSAGFYRSQCDLDEAGSAVTLQCTGIRSEQEARDYANRMLVNPGNWLLSYESEKGEAKWERRPAD